MKPRAEIAEQIQLRALRLNDFGRVVQWSRDVEFCLANGWQPSIEEEELYQWWANCVNGKTENFLRVGIEQEGLLIGYVDLADIRYGTAELGIAIGEKSFWGKGIGTAAATKLLSYAKETLGITKVFAETHKTNIRSRKMLQKLGFQEISRHGTDFYCGEETPLIQFHKLL